MAFLKASPFNLMFARIARFRQVFGEDLLEHVEIGSELINVLIFHTASRADKINQVCISFWNTPKISSSTQISSTGLVYKQDDPGRYR